MQGSTLNATLMVKAMSMTAVLSESSTRPLRPLGGLRDAVLAPPGPWLLSLQARNTSAFYTSSCLRITFSCLDIDNTRSAASQRSQQCQADATTALAILCADTETGRLPAHLAV